tara:strand:- start:1674 stop:3122 length:1449 start_codon:yes stop_codon:yes gene_type:complete
MTSPTSYLHRAASSGTQKTFTISVWCKLGNQETPVTTGLANRVLVGSDITANAENHFTFSVDNEYLLKAMSLQSNDWGFHLKPSRLIKDCSSWYHFVCRVDTTQATNTDRVRLYVNGVLQTNFVGVLEYPDQNEDTSMFEYQTMIGARKSSSPDSHWLGYMAHLHICQGYSYAASKFGETDSTTGEWIPILAPSSVSYGDNGAWLKFEDSSNLGLDSSGEGHNFTVVGSLKKSISTPSNDFCVFDPNQHHKMSNIRHAGTTVHGRNAGGEGGHTTHYMNTGKWYYEAKLGTARTDADSTTMGLVKNGTHAQGRFINGNSASAIVGKETGSNGCEGLSYQPLTGTPNIIDDGGGGTVNYGTQASQNDIIMCAFDLSGATAKIWFGKNGTWFNAPSTSSAGNPAAGTYAGLSFAKGDDFWGVSVTGADNGGTDIDALLCNFGEGRFGTTAVSSGNADDNGVGTFEYDVPAGFYAICTKNIKTYG